MESTTNDYECKLEASSKRIEELESQLDHVTQQQADEEEYHKFVEGLQSRNNTASSTDSETSADIGEESKKKRKSLKGLGNLFTGKVRKVWGN